MTPQTTPSPHEADFKALVLDHIENHLPKGEWDRFRAFACSGRPHCDPHFTKSMGETPKVLVDNAVSEDGISLYEMLVPEWVAKSVTIGSIQGAPVLYVQEHGIYAWSTQPHASPTTVLWLTHPAYPPGW